MTDLMTPEQRNAARARCDLWDDVSPGDDPLPDDIADDCRLALNTIDALEAKLRESHEAEASLGEQYTADFARMRSALVNLIGAIRLYRDELQSHYEADGQMWPPAYDIMKYGFSQPDPDNHIEAAIAEALAALNPEAPNE